MSKRVAGQAGMLDDRQLSSAAPFARETASAEFALLVADRWQGQGLGTRLLDLLVQIATREHLHRLTMSILPDNFPMQSLARKAGFRLYRTTDDGDWKAERVLSA